MARWSITCFFFAIIYVTSNLEVNGFLKKSGCSRRFISIPFISIKLTSALNAASHDLIIWDCDGVLVDSEALLKQGEVEALARAGIDMSVDDCVRLFSGVSVDEAAVNFLKEKNKELPDGFFKEQIAGSLQLFRDRLVPLMTDTVLSLQNGGYNMCVASGSPLTRVLLCLELAEIDGCFNSNSVFTRELVKRGKPAPDLFLHAAEKMNVLPGRCIVVEDSVAGIEAALAADMRVVGYLGGGHAQASWYRKAIESYDIPLAYTQKEVLGFLEDGRTKT
jgi:beta-phosphoglucomutase-like phosphatase (HAD superfamily)